MVLAGSTCWLGAGVAAGLAPRPGSTRPGNAEAAAPSLVLACSLPPFGLLHQAWPSTPLAWPWGRTAGGGRAAKPATSSPGLPGSCAVGQEGLQPHSCRLYHAPAAAPPGARYSRVSLHWEGSCWLPVPATPGPCFPTGGWGPRLLQGKFDAGAEPGLGADGRGTWWHPGLGGSLAGAPWEGAGASPGPRGSRVCRPRAPRL